MIFLIGLLLAKFAFGANLSWTAVILLTLWHVMCREDKK